MEKENITALKTKVKCTKKYVVKYFVTYVFKANFNDEMYLEEKIIEIDGLKDKPLVWFDPYLGRSKIKDTEFAIKSVTDKGMTLLVRKNGEITQEKGSWSYILCEDFNESCLLASHISRYSV
jgi:hypothetical protein